MLRSFYLPVTPVAFPDFTGAQHYMHEFDPQTPSMPTGCEQYIPMIVQMLRKAGVTAPVFVTIDEKIIPAYATQRKPGPHVDGQFMKKSDEQLREEIIKDLKPEPNSLKEELGNEAYEYFLNGPYGFNGGGWHHQGGGRWNHTCNEIPIPRMPVIVASSVAGCRVWSGCFDTVPTDQGDLSHIADELGAGEIVPANHAYLLGPDCIHESMIFHQVTQRQFIRLALPVGTI